LQGTEFAKRYRDDGIVSIPLNPGNLNSDMWRGMGPLASKFIETFLLHPPIYGAYTRLYAAFSPKITIEQTGEWGEFDFQNACFELTTL